ncbi:hypothetical protein EAI_05624 [Harpegnathos saltator]|uniref:Uncharacterized protein n=1 Tax=Harpegnathos saltator TaxID=610380 RepID=E2BZU1_HARSA|nr:hypothetical protein EAI_05624 [Harpegnathos saltator]
MSLGSGVHVGQGTLVPGANKPSPLCSKRTQRESAPNNKEVFRDASALHVLRAVKSSELADEAGRALGAVKLVAERSRFLKRTLISLLHRAATTSEAAMAKFFGF